MRTPGISSVIQSGQMTTAAPVPAFLWQVESKRVSVSLRLDVVDRLSFAVTEAFLALPKRGLEIGGLLLGNIHFEGDAVLVEIDDFEPVECDHAVGPSYLLSAADRGALEQRIRQGAPGKPSIVGFYRSHTRNEFAATPEDLKLMSDLFPDPANVLLLIHPYRDRAAEAGFVIWEGREIRSARPYLDFPFRRGALEMGRYELVTHAAPAVVAQPSSLVPLQTARQEVVLQPVLPTLAPAALRTKSASRIRREEWLAAAGLVLLAILSRVHGGVTAPKPVQESASISTPAKPAPAPAPSGFEASRPNPTPEKLQSPAPAPTSLVPRPSPFDKSEPAADKGFAAADKSDRTVPQHRAMAPLPPAPVSEAARLAAPPLPAASVEVSPPLLAAEPLSISPKIPPPARPAASVALPAFPVAHPLITVAIEPVVPVAQRVGVFHKLGFGGKARPLPDFTPPKALRQPSPEPSASQIAGIKEQVPVDVKVYIDRAGKVQYSELLSKGTGPDRDLATLAVFTSRHWEFSPARLGGEPVEAEVIVHFRFGPGSR